VPGAACACPDGSTGSADCLSDGTFYACVCPTGDIAVYESCGLTEDCESLADRCQSLTVTYPDTGTWTGGLCTYGCVNDADCIAGSTGEAGACYVILGLPDAVCYERCFDDLDCPGGFRCVEATDDLGNPLGDAICLPGN
jgi:hypothetical protein